LSKITFFMIFKKLTSSFVETFVQFCTWLRTYKKRTDIFVRYFGSFCARFAFSCTFLLHIGSAECWFGENFTLCALRNRYPLVNPRLSWACWFFLYPLLVLKPYSILKMIFEPFEIDFDPLSIFKTPLKCHFSSWFNKK